MAGLCLLLYSCGKEKELAAAAEAQFTLNDDEIEKLECMGMIDEVTKIYEDYIILGDLAMDRELLAQAEPIEINDTPNPYETEDRQNAVIFQNVVDMNQFPLQVFIGAGFNAAERTLITNGINQWNNVADCEVAYQIVANNAGADVSILDDNDALLPAGLRNIGGAGRACFPFNGRCGRFVSLDRANWGGLPNQASIVAHELGHTLGYRHADAAARGEDTHDHDQCGNDIDGIVFLHGTVNNAVNSIMTSGPGSMGVLPPNMNGAADIRAAQLLYPDQNGGGPTAVTATGVGPNIPFAGGFRDFRITWTFPAAPAYHNVEIRFVYLGGGAPFGLHNTTYVRTNDTNTLTGTWRKGNYRIEVRGMNYGRDHLSPARTRNLTL